MIVQLIYIHGICSRERWKSSKIQSIPTNPCIFYWYISMCDYQTNSEHIIIISVEHSPLIWQHEQLYIIQRSAFTKWTQFRISIKVKAIHIYRPIKLFRHCSPLNFIQDIFNHHLLNPPDLRHLVDLERFRKNSTYLAFSLPSPYLWILYRRLPRTKYYNPHLSRRLTNVIISWSRQALRGHHESEIA
jgi:hypothetical protein